MRPAIIALALLASACERGSVPQQAAPTGPSPAVGASVSEIRATPKVERAEDPYVVTAGPAIHIDTATLVDTGTGCQYTVRTLYQSELDIAPRNEPSGAGTRQICGRPQGGATPFVTLPGGSVGPIKVVIVTDRATGCQEIVGTYFQESISATPRMAAAGSGTRQVCAAR